MIRFIALLIPALGVHADAIGQDLSRVPRAEQAEAARLFAIYREGADQSAREQAAEALTKMHVTVMLALVPILERDWQLAVTNYLAAVRRIAGEVARKRLADPGFDRELQTHRATLARLRAAGNSLSKERLKEEGGPALKRLREMHTITMEELFAVQFTLASAREATAALTRIRIMLKNKTLLRDERNYTEQDLAHEEAAAIAQAFHRNQAADRIMEANAALAAKGGVPADEAEGIRNLNTTRMLLGLMPILLDPKLHIAARGHSQDMAKLKFFAHQSPVPGKKTPWDRVKLAGTTASAENIFSGSKDPHVAIEGWFFSPGHHLNMFGNHRRGGMGRHEGHWTQMFGG